MFGDIDRSEHPRSSDEMNGRGSAGPEPTNNDIDGSALARSLGGQFRPFSEPLGFGRPGDQGIVDLGIRIR